MRKYMSGATHVVIKLNSREHKLKLNVINSWKGFLKSDNYYRILFNPFLFCSGTKQADE